MIADYRGITVPVVTAMRDDFRKAGCHYRVLKNSLVKIAVKGSKMEPMTALMVGTTAVIWSTEIPQAPAKIALKWAKDEPKFKIKGGYYEGAGPRHHAGVEALCDDAGQERDPRLDAHDLPRRSAELRPRRSRRPSRTSRTSSTRASRELETASPHLNRVTTNQPFPV